METIDEMQTSSNLEQEVKKLTESEEEDFKVLSEEDQKKQISLKYEKASALLSQADEQLKELIKTGGDLEPVKMMVETLQAYIDDLEEMLDINDPSNGIDWVAIDKYAVGIDPAKGILIFGQAGETNESIIDKVRNATRHIVYTDTSHIITAAKHYIKPEKMDEIIRDRKIVCVIMYK